eukprot:SAG11_NODE_1783_length_4260_cov_5.855804_3_plen_191_part_00
MILEEHRKNCEAQGKYVEAEIAKNRLEELRQHEFSRRKEALRSRQIAERLGVEEAHMLEFQQFNAAWDKKFQEYETKAAELEEKMKVSSIRRWAQHRGSGSGGGSGGCVSHRLACAINPHCVGPCARACSFPVVLSVMGMVGSAQGRGYGVSGEGSGSDAECSPQIFEGAAEHPADPGDAGEAEGVCGSP